MPSLAAADPSTLGFDAEVERRDGDEVVLSETYFYPEGGGQPADRGRIEGVPVVHVERRDGTVVHHLDGDGDADAIAPGAEVSCTVDEEFRTYCMRAHTASHVLYGAGRRLFDDLGYGGFGITAEKVRVDFSTPTDVDDAALVGLERLVNRVVWESRPVSWAEVPREEALSRSDIAFNTKTEEGLDADTVRVVTVGSRESEDAEASPQGAADAPGDWDVAACGGTHVSNTRELGPVTVLGRSNPGEGLTRVEFAVGPDAIDRRATEKRALLAAARDLGTPLDEVPQGIERLRTDRNEAAAERDALREEVVGARLADLREGAVERDGSTWVVGTVAGLDANALADRAQDIAGDGAEVVALVADSSLAVATSGDHDASAVVSEVTEQFGGGGGGSPTVAQGGGLSADPEAVVAFLRGE
ncbi:alanyl-tRNA editing protein [Halomarina salina]|uniref:alanine--tRNA ligase n=1 Tax=Halomarina salina TaxID=1872699 RepID=A0ABD5RRW1_9EURY|nr:alanine--tRNA ligase-related protein [Halomarina salina]